MFFFEIVRYMDFMNVFGFLFVWRYYEYGNFYEGKNLIGVGLLFRDLVYYFICSNYGIT